MSESDKPFSVVLTGCSEEALESWVILWLRERGWNVTRALEWETPKEVAVRLGISSAHMSTTLREPRCPQPFAVCRGKTGRTVYLRSTPELDAYLTKHLDNHKRGEANTVSCAGHGPRNG